MRLLICCESYYPSRGGVQEVMRQVAWRLAAAGHQVTVATRHHPQRNFTALDGVEIREFKVTGNLAFGMEGEVDRYRRFVLEFGADAILIKAAMQWSFDALWPVLDQIGARKVFIPCGFSAFYEPAYASYVNELPQILRQFDHLIFYAEKYRDIDFARAHGLTRFSVLPNGASELEFATAPDPAFRARIGIFGDDFLFLTVGSPVSAKGHREVAEAFARLDTGGRPATLVLNAGDWPRARPRHPFQMVQRLSRLASRSAEVLRKGGVDELRAHAAQRSEEMQKERALHRDIERWIATAHARPGKRILRTDLPRPDVVQAFMAADLFVFASIVEYSPLVLFESAAAGTPFLSVPVGNAGEIARWTGGGVICRAAMDDRGYTRVDPSVLAQEMHRCMNDPGLLAKLGETGKEKWHANFTWRAIAPRYEAILRGQAQIAA